MNFSRNISTAIKLRLQGMTYAQIGKTLKVSRQRAGQLAQASKETRDEVRERANGICELCKTRVKRGHVHHLKSSGITPKEFNNLSNLQFLCISCHIKIHGGKPRLDDLDGPNNKRSEQ